MSKLNRVQEILRAFQERPHLYAGVATVEAVGTWLGGFSVGCLACGFRGDFETARQERGWRESEYGEIPQMRKKGLSDEEIVHELIELYVAAYESRRGQNPVVEGHGEEGP